MGRKKLKKKIKKLRSCLEKKDEEIARMEAIITELTCFGCGNALEHCPCGVCDDCSHNNSGCWGCQKKFCRYCLYGENICKNCYDVI